MDPKMEIKFRTSREAAMSDHLVILPPGQLQRIELAAPDNPLFRWASRHFEIVCPERAGPQLWHP